MGRRQSDVGERDTRLSTRLHALDTYRSAITIDNHGKQWSVKIMCLLFCPMRVAGLQYPGVIFSVLVMLAVQGSFDVAKLPTAFTTLRERAK